MRIFKTRDEAFEAFLGTLSSEDRYDMEHGIGHFSDTYNVLDDFIEYLFADGAESASGELDGGE